MAEKKALAIAFGLKRKADKRKKMAFGWGGEEDKKPKPSAPEYPQYPAQKQSSKEEFAKKFREGSGFSKGGKVKGVHQSAVKSEKYDKPHEQKRYMGESKAGSYARNADLYNFTKEKQNLDLAKDEHHKVLGEMKSMKKPKLKGLAQGGMPSMDADFAEKFKKGSGFSHGGKVMSDYSGGQKRESGHSWGKYQGQAQNEKGVHTPVSGVTEFPGGKGTSKAGDYTKDRYGGKPTFSGKDHPAIAEHKKVLKEMKKIKPKLKGLAHGGFIGEEMASGYQNMPDDDDIMNYAAMMEDSKKLGQHMVAAHDSGEQDLVDRIMHKRSADFAGLDRLSQGGMVANATHRMADEMPAEFDYLAMNDGLESHYGDDDNSGDMLGNEQEEEDRHDIIARIMASRKKKDRMPNPA